MVEPVDPLKGRELDLFDVPPGAVRRMTSALNRPKIVSARALSYESPTLPTDGSMPASAKRSV
jgi:hypothetical protein